MTSTRQSIVFFEKAGWTPFTARMWLVAHNLYPIKDVDTHLKGELHYRLADPTQFKYFRTVKTKDGIDVILGFK